MRLTKAISRWIAAGRPLRTPEAITMLYGICSTCEHFDGDICLVCECRIRKNGEILNKLAWETESCPKGHWGHAYELTEQEWNKLSNEVKFEIEQIENEPEVTLPNAIKKIAGPCRQC